MPKFVNARSAKRRRRRRKHENELRFNCLDSKQENRIKICNAQPKVVVNSQSEYDIPITHVNPVDVCFPKNSSLSETSNFHSTAVVKSEPLEYNDDIYLTQLNSKVGQLTYDKGQEFLYVKSEEIAEDKNPEVAYNLMLYEINERNPVVLNLHNIYNFHILKIQKFECKIQQYQTFLLQMA
ncbi:PREDICTED: uncharacterized protein LOC108967323 isoform X2 [Bactrocera latifrons]|uniref:Uncharacterized protein n=1 Tax=Bactrocera latifrons TaxID=174628 RepID=A0A0K8VBL4_BACLA|nr:PREDICTED: uncharacterized protein LOC108967323 isoform X2 [Bactrocera latifrons]